MLPRFCVIHVDTTDPTAQDDDSYRGLAFVFAWLGVTIEIQLARRAS